MPGEVSEAVPCAAVYTLTNCRTKFSDHYCLPIFGRNLLQFVFVALFPERRGLFYTFDVISL